MSKPNSRDLGHKIETTACLFLKKQGLHLISRNYHCPVGEIDLIMQDQDTIVFIEVRHRKNNRTVSAIESITYKKAKKIIKTAQHFLQSKNWSDKVCCRFDIVTSQYNNSDHQLDWLKNAYSADI